MMAYNGLVCVFVRRFNTTFCFLLQANILCSRRSPLRLWLLPLSKSVTLALLPQRSRQHLLYSGPSELYISYDILYVRCLSACVEVWLSKGTKVCRLEIYPKRVWSKRLLNGSIVILKSLHYKKAQQFPESRLVQRESGANDFSMDLLYFSRVLTTKRHDDGDLSEESLERMISQWIYPAFLQLYVSQILGKVCAEFSHERSHGTHCPSTTRDFFVQFE